MFADEEALHLGQTRVSGVCLVWILFGRQIPTLLGPAFVALHKVASSHLYVQCVHAATKDLTRYSELKNTYAGWQPAMYYVMILE